VNKYNSSNVRRESTRYFRKKKREYLKDKINELVSYNKNTNIRDLYRGRTEFKKVINLEVAMSLRLLAHLEPTW
jgi:hypothetical protein